jgi:diguanylate cyclase (GGDEF)-like protein/PAS domain S-box-containing protein
MSHEDETLQGNFETFFNTIDELLFVLDGRGCILHANDTVIQRLGYTREELTGQSVLMVHPPERRDEAAQITADMLAGKAEFCPVPVQTKDGLQIPVETRVKRGEWDGRPVLFGVSKDISRLKLSEEKFSKAFHASAALMGITYVNSGEFLDVNEAFLNTLGFTREEVIGHTSLELGLFVDPEVRLRVLAELEKNGALRNVETQMRAKNGAVVEGLFSVDRLYVGDTLCLLTVMTDITERKANEERERKAREFAEALHDIALALNSTLDLDQVFDRILENIKRVLECDSANILWVEGSNVRIVRTMSPHAGALFNIARMPVLEQVARSAAPLVLSDVREHPAWSLLTQTEWIRSYMAAPVIVQDELVCIISLNSATPGLYNASHLDRLRAFADQVAIAVKNARLYAQVAELATVDTLTGLYNRRHFIELANREILRARRYAEPLSVVMFDLDHYKRINDRHGHQAGDRVLVEIASLCRANLRGTDIACRYGGDEITILLPSTCLEQAMQFAERLRGLIESARIPNGKKPLKITASIGVATFQAESNTLETLLGDADRALYQAKQGRNRIKAVDS